MFFYLIRPFIRWKINTLLDDNRQPGAVMRWLLKKDHVSRKYYLTLLQLEVQLREHVSKETTPIDDVLHHIFEQQSAKGEYVGKLRATRNPSPVKMKREKKRK